MSRCVQGVEGGCPCSPPCRMVDVRIAGLAAILDHEEMGHPPRMAGRRLDLRTTLRNCSAGHGHHMSRLFKYKRKKLLS